MMMMMMMMMMMRMLSKSAEHDVSLTPFRYAKPIMNFDTPFGQHQCRVDAETDMLNLMSLPV